MIYYSSHILVQTMCLDQQSEPMVANISITKILEYSNHEPEYNPWAPKYNCRAQEYNRIAQPPLVKPQKGLS